MQQTTGTTVPNREAATADPGAPERPAVLDLPLPVGAAPAGTPIFDALLAQRRTTFALATRAERAPKSGLPTQKDQPTPTTAQPAKVDAAR